MIDDVESAIALVEEMRAALPMRAVATVAVRKTLQEASKRVFPRECRVIEVHYLGDEGGISCALNFDLDNTNNVHIVSITHLKFDRGSLLFREIRAYRKHRIKRLRKLGTGISTP